MQNNNLRYANTAISEKSFCWLKCNFLGNAEVERAQQAARQAELLASEAKKGEVEEKHKTSESLAKFPSNLWSFPSLSHGYGRPMPGGIVNQA